MNESQQARSGTTIGSRGCRHLLGAASVIAMVAALGAFAPVAPVAAQTATAEAPAQPGTQLPPVNVTAPEVHRAALHRVAKGLLSADEMLRVIA